MMVKSTGNNPIKVLAFPIAKANRMMSTNHTIMAIMQVALMTL